ncbi:putative coatomer epsilon subunit [Neospora caninum Liverpool]|uniref:Putative coatomer epsilon subunit n=1 Tax=Neospora caninum (strain Liverpool) TaxID=572307 RepID=F0VEG2_NEOCL|nr:putative coatomer epsilon subunit [Neospora caninum Liverpool]CBZ52106.1 putative coatomer epsilon subunit [Neospora caninum Liverpool]|eukprot:XP_003882138.1 putative coatomer epsilon subunit [Neospora caninum Liverpool]
MEEDELSQCRALYYVGLYDLCIARCGATHVTGTLAQQEKEGMLYACRLMQSRQMQGNVNPNEIRAMSASPNPFLRSLAVYTQFLAATSSQEQLTLYHQLRALMQEQANTFSVFFAASAAAALGNFSDALQFASQLQLLEMRVLKLQILLLMNRGDLAEEEARQVAAQNDDAPLSKLATALVDTRKAAANIQRRDWNSAFEDALKAYQQAPQDSDTLVNLICCCRNMKRHQDADFYVERLSSVAPSHPMVAKMRELHAAFANAGVPQTASPRTAVPL